MHNLLVNTAHKIRVVFFSPCNSSSRSKSSKITCVQQLISSYIISNISIFVSRDLVLFMHCFDFLQAHTKDPTRHPASTIPSPGSRYMFLLRRTLRISPPARNPRDNKNAPRRPAPRTDSDPLRAQDSCSTGDDVAVRLLPLCYGSLATTQT